MAVYGKSSHQLSLEESAFIAAMLVYPKPLKATHAWRSAVERRAHYGKLIYISNKERLKKLPGGEVL
jgi:membrane peptidoglycan carboxypeptidase